MALIALSFVSLIGTIVGALLILSGAIFVLQFAWNVFTGVMKGK